MQPLTSKTAPHTSILAALFLLLAAAAALLACGPATPPTSNPELEPPSSPGGDSEPVAETYAAVRIWTCTSPNAPSTQALYAWLIDQGIPGWHTLHAENFIVVDHVSVSVQDSLSRRDDVFAVDFIESTTPPPTSPPNNQFPDDVWPNPPPKGALKYPKLDDALDDLAVAFTKCHGTGWPAGTDPRVPVEIYLDTNLDTTATQALLSWLKANGIPLREPDYIEGSYISVRQFPASLLAPLLEQPGVRYVEKYVPVPVRPG